MSTITLNAESYAQAVRRDGIVLVDFWATWCPPCRAFGPVFEAASEKHPDIVFGKVDTDGEPDLSRSLDIMSIPTLMAFRDGVLVFSQPGALPAPALAKLISSIRDLDMAEVRRERATGGATAQTA